jgi:hypothetical protein
MAKRPLAELKFHNDRFPSTSYSLCTSDVGELEIDQRSQILQDLDGTRRRGVEVGGSRRIEAMAGRKLSSQAFASGPWCFCF